MAAVASLASFSSVTSSRTLATPGLLLRKCNRNSELCVAAPQHPLGLLRASSQDNVPAEIRDDPKFVAINDDDPSYGPTAMLLVGFDNHEIPKVIEYLKGMGAEAIVKVIVCCEDMLRETLWECMQRPSNVSNPPPGTAGRMPRICFMSGMTGQEVVTIVQSFPGIGLEDTAFAALVPKTAGQSLEQVMEEVIGDHERLVSRKRKRIDLTRGHTIFLGSIHHRRNIDTEDDHTLGGGGG
ncbi:uncharacterized protein LOC9647923 isoform X1 [Selaginella moellendorffii]|uniref:uncharacterized protein LOC9647923 isoform X1 n=1 Tax=Selaginella moellendorffii TaxID=88036 RepID=UPI000D1CD115|nr:uncharacterized protein LOC9647923 isoform X1 [Selaginella moellendorffii]|eukprot:XP_024542270.1 uncharacterized protein LOC9647923 isoform X1 [Selaginella moellendorffii]